jgi:hypothetical protein
MRERVPSECEAGEGLHPRHTEPSPGFALTRSATLSRKRERGRRRDHLLPYASGTIDSLGSVAGMSLCGRPSSFFTMFAARVIATIL